MSYNPTSNQYLTVAQSRTNNGQKDVRILLDIANNIFYSLDDDGNLNPIQSSGGGDLQGTLTLGNTTGGIDIELTDGSKITSADNIIIEATQGVNKIEINDNSTKIITDNLFLTFPLTSNEFIEKKTVFGGLNDFYTNDNLSVTLGIIQPTIPICRVKARISAYEAASNKGYYNEITAAFKLDSNGDYQVIEVPNQLQFTDFAFALGNLAANQNTIQINVAGEGVGFELGWVAQIEYSDQI
jgi:hypothetical protein